MLPCYYALFTYAMLLRHDMPCILRRRHFDIIAVMSMLSAICACVDGRLCCVAQAPDIFTLRDAPRAFRDVLLRRYLAPRYQRAMRHGCALREDVLAP